MKPAKIISVKSLGVKPTVDIQVNNKSHLYYGNGIATSNSHGFEYAQIAYWTALCKSKYPLEFFSVYLDYARHKPKPRIEIHRLVVDARRHGIGVKCPSILLSSPSGECNIVGEEIVLGFSLVKNVGASKAAVLAELIQSSAGLTWAKFLANWSSKFTSLQVESLIKAGFFDSLEGGRKEKLFQLSLWNELNKNEVPKEPIDYDVSLLSLFQRAKVVTPTAKRKVIIDNLIKALDNPPYQLVDDPAWIIQEEKNLIGTAISYTKTELARDDESSCGEVLAGKKNATIVAEIKRINTTVVKKGKTKGQEMAFVTVEDDTAELSCVCFPESYAKYKQELYDGNLVRLTGYFKDSFVINSVTMV